jgi:glycine cleavage system H protein
MGEDFLPYQRAKFATRLPKSRLFTNGHFWLGEHEPGVWRVGMTRFATRMLGEIVEIDFEVENGTPIVEGQPVGSVEGLKARSDLYTPMDGRFGGENPDLDRHIGKIHKDPYQHGWLYLVEGNPPQACLDAAGYAQYLDDTIDRMTGRSR